MLHHLETGWQRRHEPNVTLFHYADLQADLAGELLRLARVLGIPCSLGTREGARAGGKSGPDARARGRRRAERVARDLEGRARLLPERRYRRVARALSAADLIAYEARVAQLVSPDLAAWAHGGRLASGVDPER